MKKVTPELIAKSMATYQALWKPLDAGLTAADLESTRKTLREALARAEAVKTNCASCQHFALDRCNKHNADVPVEFQQVEGQCPDWQFDGVPF
jgi:hypothetical protein